MAEKNQIFVWSGENDWAISKQIQKWIAVFNEKFGDFNILRIDFEEPGQKNRLEENLKNAMQVDSLFGQNKLIILKNVFSVKLSKEIEELIVQSMEKLPENFFIVFAQTGKIDKRNKIFKILQQLAKAGQAEIKEHQMPKGYALIEWIKKQVLEFRAKISNNAVERLVFLVGNDLWQLESEIKKLASYCQDREISENDIDELVRGKFNDDIFQFVDAISAKNKARSARLLSDQLGSGANQFYLLTMITRQFRNILLIKDLKDSNTVSSPEFAARQLKMHPFVAKKTWTQADRFERQELEIIYDRLLAIEKKFKTTSWSPQLLFDLFVIGL